MNWRIITHYLVALLPRQGSDGDLLHGATRSGSPPLQQHRGDQEYCHRCLGLSLRCPGRSWQDTNTLSGRYQMSVQCSAGPGRAGRGAAPVQKDNFCKQCQFSLLLCSTAALSNAYFKFIFKTRRQSGFITSLVLADQRTGSWELCAAVTALIARHSCNEHRDKTPLPYVAT